MFTLLFPLLLCTCGRAPAPVAAPPAEVFKPGNPLIKDIGMSDPHARVFGDTVYLYTGHDTSPDDDLWDMREWRVFTTTDLVNWTQRGSISPQDNYMDDDSSDAWAADAATRNGKYYFYFSDQKRSVGVMTSDSPTGPFKDPLGKPLVSPRHDPTAFIDDDENETPYLVYGDKEESYHVGRLNEDMISLAEQPRPITITGEAWANAPKWMDKSYLFKYDSTYYLSWGRDYATSDNVYGPYVGRGAVGQGHHLDQFAHGSFFWWKGQFYHVWCYYLVNGKKYRETIMTYAHFTDDGRLVTDTDFLDQHFANGVGQYDANWDRIEAEWYYEIADGAGAKKRDAPDGGFQVGDARAGDWLRYANVTFGPDATEFTAKLIDADRGMGIEVRIGAPDGPVVATVVVPGGGADAFTGEVSGEFSGGAGRRDVYLVFTGSGAGRVGVDWFGW